MEGREGGAGKRDALIWTSVPSPGKDWTKNAASGGAPWKVIWAANWRASLTCAGAAWERAARRVRAKATAKDFIFDSTWLLAESGWRDILYNAVLIVVSGLKDIHAKRALTVLLIRNRTAVKKYVADERKKQCVNDLLTIQVRQEH
jgi:hypothetical protein